MRQYHVLLVPASTTPSPSDAEMLGRLKARGIHVLAGDSVPLEQVPAKLRELSVGQPWVEIEGAPRVLGLLSTVPGGPRLILHLLNYDQQPASNIRLRIQSEAVRGEPRLIAPSAPSAWLQVTRDGAGTAIALKSLDTYAAIVWP